MPELERLKKQVTFLNILPSSMKISESTLWKYKTANTTIKKGSQYYGNVEWEPKKAVGIWWQKHSFPEKITIYQSLQRGKVVKQVEKDIPHRRKVEELQIP